MAPSGGQSISGRSGWRRFRLGNAKLETTAGVRVASEARHLLDHPPDGVDLVALGPGAGRMVTPEECTAMYGQAFTEAGGKRALQASKAIVDLLEIKMKQPVPDNCGWNRSLYAHQLQVWQPYGLEFMMARIGKGSAVRLIGERLLEELAKEVKQSVNPAVELLIAEPKQWSRSSIKVRIKYASDCSQLGDLNRATFVCPDIQMMYAVADLLFDHWGPTACRQQARIVEYEDHYQKPMPGGYRHLQLLINISGSLWELQLNTRPMQEAKGRAGHKLYKTTRFVKEMILFASMEGDADVLREILAQPGVREVADPNAVRDANGLSALHHAAFRGDLDLVTLLLSKECFEHCANPWALDGAKCGGLPLNYAMQMRHYRVAITLVKHMVDESLLPGHSAPAAKARLAEAVAASVDAYESEAVASELGFESALRREAEELLRALFRLWKLICGSEVFQGIDPFTYALRTNSKSSVDIFFEFTDLWLVDSEGKLPIERAISLGMESTAETFSTRMLASRRPDQFPPEAAWSLARCRGQGRFPEDLVGEVIVSDLLLRRMDEATQASSSVTHTCVRVAYESQDRSSQQRQASERSEAGRRTQSKSFHATRMFPSIPSIQYRGGHILEVDQLTHSHSVAPSSARLNLPSVHPPLRQQRLLSSQAPRPDPRPQDRVLRTTR